MSHSGELLIRNMPPLETVRNARLPEIYQNAKLAISQCAQIDECKDWADKFEAIASYARQANDDGLRRMADRIQARAIRRCGDLLREIESQQKPALKQNRGGDAPTTVGRIQAAKNAGLSKDQAVTAIRVSRIPSEEFEQAIESENPPTVTALAERGRQSRPKPLVDLGEITPAQYQEATKLIGMLDGFRRESAAIDIERALMGIKKHEWTGLAESAAVCMEWLKAFVILVKEKKGCIRAAI